MTDRDRDAARLLLDANVLADDSGYVELGLTLVSPDDRLLAYSVDRAGDEVYRLRFRDLDTGEDLADEVPRSYYGGAWSADSAHFFYTVHDDAYRPYQVWRHRLGTPVDARTCWCSRSPTSGSSSSCARPAAAAWCVIWSASRDTTEVWVVDAHRPDGVRRARSAVAGRASSTTPSTPCCPTARDTLLLVTNDDATEFRLVRAPVPRDADQTHDAWAPARPEDPAERLERVDAFAGHVVLSFRSGGRQHGCASCRSTSSPPTAWSWTRRSTAGSSTSPTTSEFDAAVGHRRATSPTCSRRSGRTSTCDTGARTERHRQEAPGARPGVVRLRDDAAFPAPDGTPVPATLVRHRDTPLDGTAPALLYGLRRLRVLLEPEWDPALPTLLDRGVVFVHAHVRGGGEGGRRWWLDGRLAHKQNTFSDHLAVADGLAGLVDGGPARHPRAERRRPAAGRGVQPATGPVAGGGRRGAVRRRGHHDVRRRASR